MRIGPAAILHDIGKIGTPESILEKAGPFSNSEWRHIKEHPIVGASIIMAVPLLKELVPIIRGHHERYDGTGYPDGLIGESIHIEARVLGVIDAFDAMVSKRPYRDSLPLEEALTRLEKAKGSQFDPVVVDEFLAMCTTSQRQKEEILGHYRFQNDRHARVLKLTANSALHRNRPRAEEVALRSCFRGAFCPRRVTIRTLSRTTLHCLVKC